MVVDGHYRLTYSPEQRRPIADWLRGQKRFEHLLRPEAAGAVEEIQRTVDEEWVALRRRCGL
jgi:pyruvate ferredoxin oxidoreductase beta subunit